MRIWVDGQCFQSGSRRRGIGRYVKELLRGMAAHDDVELIVSLNAALGQEALEARSSLAGIVRPEQIHLWHGATNIGEVHTSHLEPTRHLSRIALAHHVSSLAPDVVLSASPFEGGGDSCVPYFPQPDDDHFCVAIFYDAIPHRMRKEYLADAGTAAYYDRRLAGMKNMDLLLAISEYAAEEARELVAKVDTVNISAAVGTDFLELLKAPKSKKTFRPFDPNRPVAFYVGGLDPRKNVPRAIDAIALLPPERQRDLQFVLAGEVDPTELEGLRNQWGRLSLPSENFIDIGFISDRQLVELYRSVSFVILPSLIEGFGLTALEAMMCGTPVIASRTGALKEVVGDEDLLFDPLSVDDIAQAIEMVLDTVESGEGAKRREQAKRHAKTFSWKKTAAVAVDAIKSSVAKHQSKDSVSGDELRRIAEKRLSSVGCSPQDKALIMASAEPVRLSQKRLAIDVTATSIVDRETGIQRVVKRIASALVEEGTTPAGRGVTLVKSDTQDGFFEIDADAALSGRGADATFDQPLRFGAGDTIVMLDSSWDYHRYHVAPLMAARLRGAEVVTVLYDLVPLKLPGFCAPLVPENYATWFKAALDYSDAFLCISKAVADELKAMLEAVDFPRAIRIGHWPLGADFTDSEADETP
ncbi:MAG: glycosyltransferase, partial [Pseudomonadota bacterium]